MSNRTPTLILGTLVLSTCTFLSGCNKGQTRSVSFVQPLNGTEVESPFKVEMKAENLIVEPASEGVTDGHGHFHIIIDSPIPGSTSPIPKDSMHIHYGQGQKEALLDLPAGEHTLILQFAKGDHIPYEPQISQEIKITVKAQSAK